MSIEADGRAPTATPLEHRLAPGAAAPAVAEAVLVVWGEIDAALQPIIGARGVAALLQRTAHLTAQAHPWLAPGRAADDAAQAIAELTTRMAGQGEAQALACGQDFLLTFHQLLATLIGQPLTQRLLRSAWEPPAHGEPLAAAKGLSR